MALFWTKEVLTERFLMRPQVPPYRAGSVFLA